MVYGEFAWVALAIFVSALFMIALHAVEWFYLGIVWRQASGQAGAGIPQMPGLTEGGLRIETGYYFLLAIALSLYYPKRVLWAALVLMLGLIHAFASAAFRKTGGQSVIRKLGRRKTAAILSFDVIELVVLSLLALQLYGDFQQAV